jgi:hypothetical protein
MGSDLLSTSEKEAANNFLDQLENYVAFVTRKGELEWWMKSLGASEHAPSWLIDIFSKLGEENTTSGYVKPSVGDVWDFIGQVKKWFEDPARKGIPE